MDVLERLDQGRACFAQRNWAAAFTSLSIVDSEMPLPPADLERLAVAAQLLGKDAESTEFWSRAYHELLRQAEPERAARCAFWLGLDLLLKGQSGRGGGWMAKAKRVLGEENDCAEQGLLLVPAALQCMHEGDAAGAYARSDQAARIGERFQDHDLMSLGRLGVGQVLIHQGKVAAGVALLDEVMVTVTAGDVSPVVVGIVYCAVIEVYWELGDLPRAREWTAALSSWCESQPDIVAYRGQCLVHRAEIMTLHGAWPEAIDETLRACEHFARMPDQPAAGSAFHQKAELHRLRGQYTEAEEAYREASRRGRQPQPGLALLRLAQGQVTAAASAIHRAADEVHAPATRIRLLAAHVEIALAAKDINAARAAADELAAMAADMNTPLFLATATHAAGAVTLAEGDAQTALKVLRQAWAAWQKLGVPYEAARVRILAGLACRQLGDEDSAQMELDAACWVFEHLGASSSLAQVEMLRRNTSPASASRLTQRETEVLSLIATGKTNRAIATDLILSERTVDRHVSNILNKLGLPSRSAATAYAYEHGLVQGR